MSTFEINKIVGAILLVSLVSMVIGIVAEELVAPREHEAAVATGPGEAQPAAKPEQPEPKQIEPIAPLLAKASAEQGERAARKCATCHNFKEGAGPKIGPDLWNVVGRDKGSNEGFSYSGAMQEKPGKWTYEDLNHFIADPKGFVPGTKMAFAGVKSASQRADIIAYLRTLSDNPQPLPEPGAGDAAKEGAAGGQGAETAPGGGEAGGQSGASGGGGGKAGADTGSGGKAGAGGGDNGKAGKAPPDSQ